MKDNVILSIDGNVFAIETNCSIFVQQLPNWMYLSAALLKHQRKFNVTLSQFLKLGHAEKYIQLFTIRYYGTGLGM